MFREGSELAEIWSGCSDVPLERVQRLLREDAGDQDLRAIAADAFRVQESDETLWDDLYSVLGGAGEVPAELRELIEIYRYLEPDYRRRWLENGRTFRRLTDLNYLLEAEVDEATTKLDFARRS